MMRPVSAWVKYLGLPAVISYFLVWGGPAFASTQPDEALFITRYVFGPPTIEQKAIDDLSCHAFTVTDTSWRLEKALTISASIPVFYRSIEDIAPAAKGHVFFGLDKQDHLCIFDSKPPTGHIIRQFDRISISAMCRGVPKSTVEQLKRGIPIQSIEEYRSVLSTFLRYSSDMNPAAN